jgi:hypothetical protein
MPEGQLQPLLAADNDSCKAAADEPKGEHVQQHPTATKAPHAPHVIKRQWSRSYSTLYKLQPVPTSNIDAAYLIVHISSCYLVGHLPLSLLSGRAAPQRYLPILQSSLSDVVCTILGLWFTPYCG